MILDIVYSVMCSFLPIKKNTALFVSFRGLYSDNPKRVSIELHNRFPEFKIYWAIASNSNETLPEYICRIPYGSKKHEELKHRAQIVIENYNGIRKKDYHIEGNFIKKGCLRFWCRKRKKQYNISTWHGTPLKRIAFDELNTSKNTSFYTSSDYLVSGCRHTTTCFETAFRNILPIRNYGTPRNDPLLNDNHDVNKLKKKLNIPIESKVVLFAPTFRQDLEMGGIYQMQHINFDRLFNALNQKFSGDWVFVYRLHNNVQDVVSEQMFDNKRIINGNIGDDMTEYLQVADVLLTDYSSSMFDYLLTNKPCFLFVPDLEKYCMEERGVYIDFSLLPFPYALNEKELEEAIREFNELEYDLKIEKLKESMCTYEKGHASERIVNDIEMFIRTGKKH